MPLTFRRRIIAREKYWAKRRERLLLSEQFPSIRVERTDWFPDLHGNPTRLVGDLRQYWRGQQ